MKKPAKLRKRKKRPIPKCGWCGHTRNRHTIAGCMGDGGPGSNCSCDEFVVGVP